jgi:hypothetical protein
MAPTVESTTGVEQCVSCGAPLSGSYCAQCGERTLERDALTLRHFLVHTVASELLSVDGALWRTLRLLFFRPGQLAREYAAGRRRGYVNPFRLLLIAIVVYLLMTASGFIVTWNFGPVQVSMAPPVPKRSMSLVGESGLVANLDPYGLLRSRVAAKQAQLASDAARERFNDRLAAFAQPFSFANVLLLAVALHVGFLWTRRRFLEHLAFSMHVMSFVLLSSPVILMHRLIDGPFAVFLVLSFGVAIWQFAHLTIAIRRFYLAGSRWGGRLVAMAAALILYALNTIFVSAVQVAGAAIALALA